MDDLHFLFSLKHLNISSRHDAEQITFTLQLPLLIIIKGLRTQSVKLNLGNQFMMFLVCLITKMTIDTNIAFANNLPNGKLRLRFNFPGEMGITKPWSCLWSIQVRPISTRITDNTPRQVFQTKDFKIGICCFSAKHAVLRRKSKDWLARNQNNVSTRGLLFQ
jgi:hypothetical protein